jgi:hypothetical protein
MFVNANAGNINSWTYSPTNVQATNDEYWLNGNMKLTWQASQRNKITLYYEDAIRCTQCDNGGAVTTSPEATGHGATHPDGLDQVTWTSPLTNRLLLEAGFSFAAERWGSDPRPGFTTDFISVTAQGGSIPGLTYRAPGPPNSGAGGLSKSFIGTYSSRASMTYTSGSHSMKFGYNGEAFNYSQAGGGVNPLKYRFTTPDPGGQPNQVTVTAIPYEYFEHLNNWGLYAQDQWTSGRFTIGGGLRFDRFTAFFPDSHIGPSLYMPNALTFAAVETTALNDITPRFSFAYDLTGDGKTAVKVGINKYMLSQSSEQYPLGGQAAPLNGVPTSYSRSWTDSNNNKVVNCDLLNLAAQDLSATGGDICGPSNQQTYGTATKNTSLDPSLSHGWGNRPYNWAFDASLTREVTPNVAVNFGYFRRIFGNFVVVQNRLTAPSDYTFFNLTVNDPRLPINGQTVTGFFDVSPDKFGKFDNYVTKADNFGGEMQHWNGFDIGVNARFKGATIQGGVSTGRLSKDVCAVAQQIPTVLSTANTPIGGASASATSIAMQYCHTDQPFQTQLKALGTYTVPKVDVLVSATLQNIPGQETFATYNIPTAIAKPLLGGRDLSEGANIPINLLPPGQYYSDRVNQLDMRLAKIVRFRGVRTQVGLDLYNALNTNTVQTYNATYSPTATWPVPTLIVPARLARISAQINF